MPVVVESREEFAARHGGRPLIIDGVQVFETGARLSGDGQERREPLHDAHQNARVVRRYHEVAAMRAGERFEARRAELLEAARVAQANNRVPPPARELEALAALRDAARAATARLEEAREEERRTAPPLDLAAERARAAKAEMAAEFIAALDEYKL